VPDSGDDGSIACTLTFIPPGFSSLTPVATLCAQLGTSWSETCGSWTAVGQYIDGGDCGAVWLFDTATGDLVAYANQCVSSPFCAAVTPGFQYPSECFPQNLNGISRQICPIEDDGGAGDARTDAPVGDSSTDASGD
jgi:hypothetical protein